MKVERGGGGGPKKWRRFQRSGEWGRREVIFRVQCVYFCTSSGLEVLGQIWGGFGFGFESELHITHPKPEYKKILTLKYP